MYSYSAPILHFQRLFPFMPVRNKFIYMLLIFLFCAFFVKVALGFMESPTRSSLYYIPPPHPFEFIIQYHPITGRYGIWVTKHKYTQTWKNSDDGVCWTEFTEFFWTFSIVRYSKKHDVSETGSVSVLRLRWREDTYSVIEISSL
jgi:hypothetical protein